MKDQIRSSLIETLARMGYPGEFGALIADELGYYKEVFREQGLAGLLAGM